MPPALLIFCSPSTEDKEVLSIWAVAICILVLDGIWRGEAIGVLLACLCMATTAINQISGKRRSTETEQVNGESAPAMAAQEKRGTELLESWALSATIVTVAFSRNIWLAGLPSWQDFALILLFGTLATWLPDLCYVQALKRIELLHAVVVSRIGNVLTPILIWLILGEQMPVFSVIPAVMVIAVVTRFLIQQEERERQERIKEMQRIWRAVAEKKLTSQEGLERAILSSQGSIGVRLAFRLITQSSSNQSGATALDKGVLMEDIDRLLQHHWQIRSSVEKP